MLPLSAEAQELLRGSHTRVSKIEFSHLGEPLTELVTTVSGTVTKQRAAVIHRGEFSFVDQDGSLTPKEATDLLSPLAANDVRVFSGVLLSDGTPEYIPVATLRLQKAVIDYPNISVSGYDYAKIISDARVETARAIGAGSNVISSISDVLLERYPFVETNFPTTGETTPMVFFDVMSDPWEILQKLAESIGMWLRFDAMGVAQMSEEPDLSSDFAVWDFSEGGSSNVTAVSRDLDIETSYNAVAVYGEAMDDLPPVFAYAYDNDPESATYYFGPYGKRPREYQSELITTSIQAYQAGLGMLRKELGLAESVAVEGLINPALEVGDIVQIHHLDSGVDANYVIDQFPVPLRGATMNLTTRSKQVWSG